MADPVRSGKIFDLKRHQSPIPQIFTRTAKPAAATPPRNELRLPNAQTVSREFENMVNGSPMPHVICQKVKGLDALMGRQMGGNTPVKRSPVSVNPFSPMTKASPLPKVPAKFSPPPPRPAISPLVPATSKVAENPPEISETDPSDMELPNSFFSLDDPTNEEEPKSNAVESSEANNDAVVIDKTETVPQQPEEISFSQIPDVPPETDEISVEKPSMPETTSAETSREETAVILIDDDAPKNSTTLKVKSTPASKKKQQSASETPKSVATPEPTSSHPPNTSSSSEFVCCYCARSFISKKSLSGHVGRCPKKSSGATPVVKTRGETSTIFIDAADVLEKENALRTGSKDVVAGPHTVTIQNWYLTCTSKRKGSKIRYTAKVEGILKDHSDPSQLQHKGKVWHSTVITSRASSHSLSSRKGTVYNLDGDMDLIQAEKHGLRPDLRELFAKGFPENWNLLLKDSDEVLAEGNMVVANPPIVQEPSPIAGRKPPVEESADRNSLDVSHSTADCSGIYDASDFGPDKRVIPGADEKEDSVNVAGADSNQEISAGTIFIDVEPPPATKRKGKSSEKKDKKTPMKSAKNIIADDEGDDVEVAAPEKANTRGSARKSTEYVKSGPTRTSDQEESLDFPGSALKGRRNSKGTSVTFDEEVQMFETEVADSRFELPQGSTAKKARGSAEAALSKYAALTPRREVARQTQTPVSASKSQTRKSAAAVVDNFESGDVGEGSGEEDSVLEKKDKSHIEKGSTIVSSMEEKTKSGSARKRSHVTPPSSSSKARGSTFEVSDSDHEEPKEKKSASKSQMPSRRNSYESPKATVVISPGSQRSRSGRSLIPPLEFWRNQMVERDVEGTTIGILEGGFIDDVSPGHKSASKVKKQRREVPQLTTTSSSSRQNKSSRGKPKDSKKKPRKMRSKVEDEIIDVPDEPESDSRTMEVTLISDGEATDEPKKRKSTEASADVTRESSRKTRGSHEDKGGEDELEEKVQEKKSQRALKSKATDAVQKGEAEQEKSASRRGRSSSKKTERDAEVTVIDSDDEVAPVRAKNTSVVAGKRTRVEESDEDEITKGSRKEPEQTNLDESSVKKGSRLKPANSVAEPESSALATTQKRKVLTEVRGKSADMDSGRSLFDHDFDDDDDDDDEGRDEIRKKGPGKSNPTTKKARTEKQNTANVLWRKDSMESSTDREIMPDEYFDEFSVKSNGADTAPLKKVPSWPKQRRTNSTESTTNGTPVASVQPVKINTTTSGRTRTLGPRAKRGRVETAAAKFRSESEEEEEEEGSGSDFDFSFGNSKTSESKRPAANSKPVPAKNISIKKKSSAKKTNDEDTTDFFWTRELVDKLYEVAGSTRPGVRTFWEDVAKKIPGTTAEMCRSKFEAQHATPKIFTKKSKRKTDKISTAATVSDFIGKGKKKLTTMKDKVALREVIADAEAGHLDDYFSATPLRATHVSGLPSDIVNATTPILTVKPPPRTAPALAPIEKMIEGDGKDAYINRTRILKKRSERMGGSSQSASVAASPSHTQEKVAVLKPTAMWPKRSPVSEILAKKSPVDNDEDDDEKEDSEPNSDVDF